MQRIPKKNHVTHFYYNIQFTCGGSKTKFPATQVHLYPVEINKYSKTQEHRTNIKEKQMVKLNYINQHIGFSRQELEKSYN